MANLFDIIISLLYKKGYNHWYKNGVVVQLEHCYFDRFNTHFLVHTIKYFTTFPKAVYGNGDVLRHYNFSVLLLWKQYMEMMFCSGLFRARVSRSLTGPVLCSPMSLFCLV